MCGETRSVHAPKPARLQSRSLQSRLRRRAKSGCAGSRGTSLQWSARVVCRVQPGAPAVRRACEADGRREITLEGRRAVLVGSCRVARRRIAARDDVLRITAELRLDDAVREGVRVGFQQL